MHCGYSGRLVSVRGYCIGTTILAGPIPRSPCRAKWAFIKGRTHIWRHLHYLVFLHSYGTYAILIRQDCHWNSSSKSQYSSELSTIFYAFKKQKPPWTQSRCHICFDDACVRDMLVTIYRSAEVWLHKGSHTLGVCNLLVKISSFTFKPLHIYPGQARLSKSSFWTSTKTWVKLHEQFKVGDFKEHVSDTGWQKRENSHEVLFENW